MFPTQRQHHERSLRDRLVAYLLLVVTAATLMVARAKQHSPIVDFQQFYLAAQMVRHGDAAKLYDFNAQAAYETHYANPARPVTVPSNPFLYPAATVLPFLPLAWLSLNQAWTAWLGVNLLLLLASVRLLQRELAIPQGEWPLAIALLCAPVLSGLWGGQVCFLLLLLYTLAFVAMRRPWLFLAGFAVGLAALKFQLMIGFVLVLLLLRCWKFVAGAAVGSCVIAGLSALIIGPRQLLGYPDFLRHAAFHRRVAMPMIMPNIRGLLALTAGNEPPVWVVAAISAILIIWAAKAWKNTERGFALAMIVTVLTAYHAYVQELTLLVIPLAVAAQDLEWSSARAVGVLMAVLAVNGILFWVGAAALMSLSSALLLIGLLALQDEWRTPLPSL